MDFDGERSEAALSALVEFAHKLQVILFTHHSGVVEQAGELRASVKICVHEL